MFTLIPLMAADSNVDFARDVAPIFEKRCLGCHGPQMQMSGLRLDRNDSARFAGTYSAIKHSVMR